MIGRSTWPRLGPASGPATAVGTPETHTGILVQRGFASGVIIALEVNRPWGLARSSGRSPLHAESATGVDSDLGLWEDDPVTQPPAPGGPPPDHVTSRRASHLFDRRALPTWPLAGGGRHGCKRLFPGSRGHLGDDARGGTGFPGRR